MDTDALLRRLGLGPLNPGAWSGTRGWSNATGARAHQRAQSRRRRAAGAGAPGERRGLRARHDARRWRRRRRGARCPRPSAARLVRLLGEELRRHKDDLGTLVSLENGKILAEGLGEVQEMIDIADFAVGQSRMLYGLTMHSERPQHRMYEQWHPLGVVGIISAFNFPVAVWSWNAFLGAICGNACVWKPSPKTPLTRARRAAPVQPGAGEPAAAGRSSSCSSTAAPSSPRVSSTTGAWRWSPSPARPRSAASVGERVAARLGKSLLELGGNNAVIVDETANLDLAVPAIVFGAVGTAGQRCTSTRRVFVHQAIAAELEQRLVHAYGQVRIGDPLDARHPHGPADRSARRSSAIEARDRRGARRRAARCSTAATCSSGPGNFVEPTIVRARNDWPIVQTETFAPILYLIPVDSLERGDRAAERLRARTVLGAVHRPAAERRGLPVGRRQRLRHRQHQSRHLGRRDRRRLWRREGHRRRPRIRLGCLEGLHAPPDQHDQLEPRAAARAGHRVQGLRAPGQPQRRSAPRRAREVSMARRPPYRSTVSCTMASPSPWPGTLSSARTPRSQHAGAILGRRCPGRRPRPRGSAARAARRQRRQRR